MGNDPQNFPQAPLPPQQPYTPPQPYQPQQAYPPPSPPPQQPYHPPPPSPPAPGGGQAPPPGAPAQTQQDASTISMPAQPQPAPYAPPSNQPAERARSNTVFKWLVVLVAGSLSLLAISLEYAIRLRTELVRSPEGPLAISAVVTFLALFLSISVCFEGQFGALIPLVSSIVAGGLLILLYAVLLRFKNDFVLPDINVDAVVISHGVFGAISLGSLIGYCLWSP